MGAYVDSGSSWTQVTDEDTYKHISPGRFTLP